MQLEWIQKLHLAFVGLSCFTIILSLIFSSLYLIQQRQLKHKKTIAILHMPSLEKSDHYAIGSLIACFACLSTLLVTGILLAHLVWHNDWIRDEKFIIAICTWIWVLLTLVFRFRFGFRGEKFFYSLFFGFILLVASCVVAWMV